MKYKVGDKVRVRQWDDMVKEFGFFDDLKKDIDIPGCTFVNNMKKFCGRVVTISSSTISCGNDIYTIKEDDQVWYWADEMFENVYYSCADKITKDLQEAYDKVYESIFPKYPKHNDMLDTFTKIPKGEIKITAEETKEMVKKNIETEIEKKKVHPKDEDHLKRVEKIQKRINYYKNVSGFQSIEEVVPKKVVKVKYLYDEYKMKCDSRDAFSMEKVLYLTLAKYFFVNTYTSEGIEKKAEELKYEKKYAKTVEQGIKLLAAMEELEKENAEYEALLEARRQKRWERKQRQMDRRAEKKKAQEEKEREEKIQIQTEAYLRAMKAVKEEEKKEENVPVEEENNEVESKPEENMTETIKKSTKESTENIEKIATTTE